MKYLSPILFALVLVFTLGVSPVGAQESDARPDAREAQLREWYNGLGKNRQDELKKRFRAFKHLPKDRQEQILQAAKDGRPILTDQQRENLRKLKKMSFLERVRLYTTAAELNALRRGPKGADARAAFEAGDRKKLREMMIQQRVEMYFRNLPPAERMQFRRLSTEEQMQQIQADHKNRLEELMGIYPRIGELRDAASKGDKDARRELKQLMADLRTLDQLLQRLSPEKRQEMLAELKDLSMDKAAEQVRRALQDQWQRERKQPRDRNDTPRVVPDRNNRRSSDRKGPRER